MYYLISRGSGSRTLFLTLPEARDAAALSEDPRYIECLWNNRYPLTYPLEETGSGLWYFPYGTLVLYRDGITKALYANQGQVSLHSDGRSPQTLYHSGYREVSIDFLMTEAQYVGWSYREALIDYLV